MISVDKPVLFDCRVANLANCFPMIPSGKAHNEMLLPDEANDEAGRERDQRRRQVPRLTAKEFGPRDMNAQNVDAPSAYFLAEVSSEIETHTLSLIVDNEPGVLRPRDRTVLRGAATTSTA